MKSLTMTGLYFNNPIKILHRLKEAGFTEQQAEAQVEIFNDYVEHGLATKQDLKEVRRELREVESSIKRDFELKIKELELKLTVKTAAIVGSIVGFFSILEKFIK